SGLRGRETWVGRTLLSCPGRVLVVIRRIPERNPRRIRDASHGPSLELLVVNGLRPHPFGLGARPIVLLDHRTLVLTGVELLSIEVSGRLGVRLGRCRKCTSTTAAGFSPL